ncbi:hypothetical protein SERLADRAFT_463888 [Serpula lacrymans var. lacrymans S7.9]|uniref:Uncharacterized protein n=1 Tax=Serpula lacrymans var. lacrymans (strain S7.9) TaxID=578457 RepID=F8NQN5_SERL9|nr:uncharacterized protein SERLADRAFT_463888 [Serpula lacrymans var. lacrymans S7.9]EGO26641.1 hypothetical protein SERLADRAFT_463888 [Serpula lacrymans var. lacrymans S7.9]
MEVGESKRLGAFKRHWRHCLIVAVSSFFDRRTAFPDIVCFSIDSKNHSLAVSKLEVVGVVSLATPSVTPPSLFFSDACLCLTNGYFMTQII